MKKIGIFTFYHAENYGAVLQAFALQNIILKIIPNCDISIIDYTPRSILNSYKILQHFSKGETITLKIKAFCFALIELPFTLSRKINFFLFRKKYLRITNMKYISDFDYVVCGSDQIWNSDLTGGIDNHYYGLIKNFRGKSISYAASDGGKLTQYDKSLIGLFNNFASISVRESSMIARLKLFTQKNIFVAMDPVLLPGIKFWDSICYNLKDKGYILVYQLENNPDILKEAKELAGQTGKKIIEICYFYPIRNKLISLDKYQYIIKVSISPQLFVSYFKNADYILTNSFHGTAFSLLFKKQFCSYKLKSRGERLQDLLLSLGLMDRYVSSCFNTIFEWIDYDKVEKKIIKKQQESYDYLIQALGGV